ncbi:uncharacterized protein LOC123711923 isoform X2 [Pieris brassicae]|uniref:U5 small nuclear ribonucleoprotein TSSC4 n=2 Tax=Pieris brassicae TaxID=7116 RepID=A0A9P0TAU0_PIEBR|nr:uncharacterized protein LOC123711923 isoform X2 [Pieris brassicae]XP_045520743.1 uncharacterized protein LOC123711923 isoform X2 [Pieris brassicae]CAH4007063.1 unnamed protein product [Pieris brassicae]
MASFHERQKSLFNTLKDAEDQYSFSKSNKVTRNEEYGEIDKHQYRKLKREMKQFRGKESIYKRTESSLKDCLQRGRIPDYMKNPQKWSYYSLSDVTPDQMSDSTNAATALAFIQEMEQRKESFSTITDETGAVFKKPTFQISKTIKPKVEEDTKIVFKSNKIIMPEYVVGVSKAVKSPKKLRIKKSELTNTVELKLNHLYDDDNEDTE